MEKLEQEKMNSSVEAGPSIQFFDEAYQGMPKDPKTSAVGNSSGSGSFFNSIKNHKKWIATIAASFVLAGGALFGLAFYEHYLRVLPIENILPADANIVAKITINPDGQQFKLLEANLEKFPGYSLVKRKLDDAGGGKTFSQLIQDKFKEKGLDFETDIKPVISEQAYVVIPDAGPLGKNIQNEALLTFDNKKSRYLASADKPENDGKAVLGESDEKTKLIPVDFIVASEILDKGKAKEVLEKLQKDGHYKVTAKKDNGYVYYELKGQDSGSDNPGLVNYPLTYHALLGSNWVFASNEDYMKKMIVAAKKEQFFSSIFSKKEVASLKNDADFQKVKSDLGDKGGDNLVQAYYKLNFSEFFGKRDCGGGDCPGIADYIKYPENIISGFLVHVETNGIAITMDSNGTSLGDLQNVSAEKNLAQIIPKQVGQRWTDVYFEYSNLKDLYYNFKKNNLTEKGLAEWNDAISEIKDTTGIDPEVNLIDLIKGSGTFMLLTKKDDSPEGAVIFEITDAEKMNGTMHKLVEAIKRSQIESYTNYITMGGADSFKGSTDPRYAKMAKKMQDAQKKYQVALDKVKSSAIKETVLPEGKIYSYAIESPATDTMLPAYSVTLNYSLEDGRFIFSTDYPAVQSLLAGLKNGSQEASLAKSENYKTASRYFAPEMYTNSYVYTQGICNSMEYFFHKFTDSLSSLQTSMCAEMGGDACQKQQEEMAATKQKQDDGLFAALSVIRTLKLTGGYSAMADKSIKTAWFLNIVEIPKEEKNRAERILEQL